MEPADRFSSPSLDRELLPKSRAAYSRDANTAWHTNSGDEAGGRFCATQMMTLLFHFRADPLQDCYTFDKSKEEVE